MDILEPKKIGDLSDDIKKVLNVFKFKNKSIKLNGSSSLKSQQYFGDIDLYTLTGKPNLKDFHYFQNIMLNFTNANLYFIELKIQLLDGDKVKFYDINDFDFETYKKYYEHTEYIKIDFVLYTDNKFIECSVIYDFGKKKQNLKASLQDDFKQFIKEGKYYKALKRLFNLYKLEKNNNKNLKILSRFFNSEYGLAYRNISNLEACNLVSSKYKSKYTRDRVKGFLRDMRIKNTEKYIKDNLKIINQHAKHLLEGLMV
jgi:hypothetical protein